MNKKFQRTTFILNKYFVINDFTVNIDQLRHPCLIKFTLNKTKFKSKTLKKVYM